MPRLLLATLAAVVWAVPTPALSDELKAFSGPQLDVRSLTVSCVHGQNDTSTLRTALEAGGSAAGRTLFIPSGCKILLGSPGANDSVADLASNTTLDCEDGTAGFILARKVCVGGHMPGAACSADADCNGDGATCVADAGGPFAPTEGSTYTVFGAATGAVNAAIRNCGIWVEQLNASSAELGGTGNNIGYCEGGTRNGKSCNQVCPPFFRSYKACTSDADCTGVFSGPCANRSDCATASPVPGTCVAVPTSANFGPSGPGKIHPIDFTNCTDCTVENVKIYDHKVGDFSIRSGTANLIRGSSNHESGTTGIPALYWPRAINAAGPRVTTGLVLGSWSEASHVDFCGFDSSVDLGAFAKITHAKAGAYGVETMASWKGTIAFRPTSQGAGITESQLTGSRGEVSSDMCQLPLIAVEPGYDAYNYLAEGNYFDGNLGPKFVIVSAGNQLMDMRDAWGSESGVVAYGEMRGRCSGGTRSGLVCLGDSPPGGVLSCPSSSCAWHADFKLDSGSSHSTVSGGLVHTNVAKAPFFTVSPWKQCQTGVDRGKGCDSSSDCASGTACDWPRIDHFVIYGINIYGAHAKSVCFDASNFTSLRADAAPSITRGVINMHCADAGTGVKMPGADGVMTLTTVDGEMDNVTTTIDNWARFWAGNNDASKLSGLVKSDDQCTVVNLEAGESVARGQLVSPSSSTDAAVVRTTASAKEKAFGIAMNAAGTGGSVKVCTSGTTWCLADGAIARGDLLTPSGATDGRTVASSSSSDHRVGVSIGTGAAGTLFQCVFGSS